MGLTKLAGSFSFPDFVCLMGCIVLILYLALSLRIPIMRFRFQLAWIAFACGSSSMVCLTLINMLVPAAVAQIIGAALFAFFLITFCLLWLDLYKSQNIIMAIIYLLFSTILGYLFSWLMLELDSMRSACALVGMVSLSLIFLLHGLSKNPYQENDVKSGKEHKRLPIGFILISFIFSVSYMYAIMTNGLQSFHSVFTWDLPIASLILLVVCFLMRKRLTFIRLFSLAAPLMIIGLLLALFINVNSAFLFNLFHLGFFVYLGFILVLYCGCTQEQNVNSLQLACFLILGIFVGCFAGRLLYPLLTILFPSFIQQSQSAASILIVGLLVICTIHGSIYIYRLFGSATSPESFETLGAIGETILDAEQITDLYGLSERESEVLNYLLEGKSATQIANEMVVAHGTIKAHIRNIYRKTGIHTRDELFALTVKTR